MGDPGAQPAGAPLAPHLTEFGYPVPTSAPWLEQQPPRPQYTNRSSNGTGYKYPYGAYGSAAVPQGHYVPQSYPQMWTETSGEQQPAASVGTSPYVMQNGPVAIPAPPQPRSQPPYPHVGGHMQPEVPNDAPSEVLKSKKPAAERKKRSHAEKSASGITWQSTYKGPPQAAVPSGEPVIEDVAQYPPAPSPIPAAVPMPLPQRRDAMPHPHGLMAQPPHMVVAAAGVPLHPGQDMAIQYIRMPHGYAYPAYTPPPPTQTRMTLESAWAQWQFIMTALDPETMRRFATIVLRDLLGRGILLTNTGQPGTAQPAQRTEQQAPPGQPVPQPIASPSSSPVPPPMMPYAAPSYTPVPQSAPTQQPQALAHHSSPHTPPSYAAMQQGFTQAPQPPPPMPMAVSVQPTVPPLEQKRPRPASPAAIPSAAAAPLAAVPPPPAAAGAPSAPPDQGALSVAAEDDELSEVANETGKRITRRVLKKKKPVVLVTSRAKPKPKALRGKLSKAKPKPKVRTYAQTRSSSAHAYDEEEEEEEEAAVKEKKPKRLVAAAARKPTKTRKTFSPRKGNIWAAESDLSRIDLRDVVNAQTFALLRPEERDKLLELLPKVDTCDEATITSLFTNPQLTSSFALVQKMLQDGEFERGFDVEMEPRKEELRGWKKKYYEEYWGEKLKSETRRPFEVEMERMPRFSYIAAACAPPSIASVSLALPTYHSFEPSPALASTSASSSSVASSVPSSTPVSATASGMPPVVNPETTLPPPPSDADSGEQGEPKRASSRHDASVDRTQRYRAAIEELVARCKPAAFTATQAYEAVSSTLQGRHSFSVFLNTIKALCSAPDSIVTVMGHTQHEEPLYGMRLDPGAVAVTALDSAPSSVSAPT